MCVRVYISPTLQNKLSAWIFLGKLETLEETNGSENSTIRLVVYLKDWKNTASDLHRLPRRVAGVGQAWVRGRELGSKAGIATSKQAPALALA